LAAALAFGLVTSDPHRDGNKRIGFLAMVTLLGIRSAGERLPPRAWARPTSGVTSPRARRPARGE
jgi:hypothetical protein